MAYSFIFTTEALYLEAKASGGSIYTALCTNEAGYVTRSAISFCEDTGKTYVDSINVLVEKEYGEIGDCLLYNTNTSTYCWLKSNAAWDATSKGSCSVNEADLTSVGYEKVGFCIHRHGDEFLIISCDDLGSYTYSATGTSTIAGVATYSTIARENNSPTTYDTWVASSSCYWIEKLYAQTVSVYTWPLPRYYWNVAKTAAYANTAASGTFTNGSYTVTAGTTGMGTASITYTCTEGSVTINPADYDWDFDKWYRNKILLRFPASSGCMQDFNGLENTKALVASSISTPAADACYTYTVYNVPNFNAGKWWLPSTGESWYMFDNLKSLNAKGFFIDSNKWYWSSTQVSSDKGWAINMVLSCINSGIKVAPGQVRAVSVFKLDS